MPVCTGGSEPQDNAPAYLSIDYNFMASLLPLGLQWIKPFLPYLPPIQLETAVFCSTDPPSLPTLDGSVFFNLITAGKGGLALSAAELIAQAIYYYAWYKYCQCSTMATPAPSAPPSAPTDLPQINPPASTLPSAADACLSRIDAFDGHNNLWIATYGFDFLYVPSPPPQTMRLKVAVTPQGATHDNALKFEPQWYLNGTFVSLGAQFTIFANGERIFAVPSGVNQLDLKNATSGGGASTDLYTVTTDIYCAGGAPGVPTGGCCPPDPAVGILVGQVLELATLIQRQAVPFAYVPGDAHVGISGTGELAVQGLIGARVVVTDTLGGTIGSDEGNPDFQWGLGWINWGTVDGYLARERLESNTTLSLPWACGAYTRLAYSLAPGVEVTIVELEREP